MTTYEAILRNYRAEAERRRSEEEWWSDPTIGLCETIVRACLSEVPSNGRSIRHGHQCLLRRGVPAEAARILASLEHEISGCASFDELHDLITNVCSTLYGAGELYAYDVAQRVGLRLGLRPERVFLHRGTRAGARALGISVSGRKSIGIDELPRALRSLSPAEAEDVLCIYKSYFPKLDRNDDDASDARSCLPRSVRSRRC